MKKASTSRDENRVVRTIKGPKQIIITCILFYLLIAGIIVGNSVLDALILNGKYERKRADEELLAYSIPPKSITRILNASSELKMDGKVILDGDQFYLKVSNEYKNIASDEIVECYSPLIGEGYILGEIMINTIDSSTILVHPQNWPLKKDDRCAYEWRKEVYNGEQLDKDKVHNILLRQDTECISVGEAAAIIGLIKEGSLLGYYCGTVLFADLKENSTLDLTWITSESKEYTGQIRNVDNTKPIMGIGNHVICVDQDGYLVTSYFGREIPYRDRLFDDYVPINTYNAYLDDPTGELNEDQTLYINLLTKDRIMTISEKHNGDRTLMGNNSGITRNYPNICGNADTLVLWDDSFYMELNVMKNETNRWVENN